MLFPDESYHIMGACFEVHNHLGCGFLEAVYQEALATEFAMQHVPYVAQSMLQINYKGNYLTQVYQADFICFSKILVEIKALDSLVPKHEAQVLNYLHATGLELGLLINFGAHPKLESKRIALSKPSFR
jgi:GxxExxY protein